MDERELIRLLATARTPAGFRFGPSCPGGSDRWMLDEFAGMSGLGQDAGRALGVPDVQGPACAALPSGQSTYELVRGDWSALPRVAFFTACRAGLVALGIAAARRFFDGKERRPDPHLIRDSIAGALGIEAFVVGWAVLRDRSR